MQVCPGCKKPAHRLRPVDVPEGLALCDDCYGYVWKCDSCKMTIASSDFEGGEDPGMTPLLNDAWCEACCEQKIDQCVECGADDLIEDMKKTEGGLLCESCARGYGPESDDSPRIKPDNWRDAALEAIRELPDNLQASIGHRFDSDHSMIVTMAVEPASSFEQDELPESDLARVVIRYRDSIWNINPTVDQDEVLSGNVDYWPVISIIAQDSHVEVNAEINVLAGTVAAFKRTVQIAIMETLYSGSLICKDYKRRYVWDDGTRILEWQ